MFLKIFIKILAHNFKKYKVLGICYYNKFRKNLMNIMTNLTYLSIIYLKIK